MSILSRLGSALPRLFTRAPRRGYGSAAAIDYDYYYYEEDEEPHNSAKRREITASDGWEKTWRGVQWVIMGDPMVRRHVYAERLAELLEVPHISMGSLVRQELNPNSPLYKKIAKSVNQGKLVPEDVIFGLLSKRLEEGYCRGETGFILDGIPRTRMQAEILDQIADIDLVLNLKCSEKSFGSEIYSPSQDFHSMANSGFNLSNKDSEALLKEKLRMYAEQRKPLEEYYKKQKKLLDFQVSGPPGDTWQGLLAALHLQHMSRSVVDKSQKLTA